MKPIEAEAARYQLSPDSWRPRAGGMDLAQACRHLDAYLDSHGGSGHRTTMLTAFRDALRARLAPAATAQTERPHVIERIEPQEQGAVEQPSEGGAVETIVALGGLEVEALEEAAAALPSSPFEPPAQQVSTAEDATVATEDADTFLTVLMGNESPTEPPPIHEVVEPLAAEALALDQEALDILDKVEVHELPPLLCLDDSGMQSWQPPLKESAEE